VSDALRCGAERRGEERRGEVVKAPDSVRKWAHWHYGSLEGCSCGVAVGLLRWRRGVEVHKDEWSSAFELDAVRGLCDCDTLSV
jgi:hypothetical protein